jgi:translation initiation factor 3 subunit M
MAVSNPTVFDFDSLFKLDAVVAAHSHPLFTLLRIFLSGGLDDLRAWQRAHADIIGSYSTILAPFALQTRLLTKQIQGLDTAQLERKVHLLALADLGFQNIGQDLPYAHVAAALQVSPSEVERWVIDGTLFGPSLTDTAHLRV